MSRPLRNEAYDETNSVGALIVAGIIGAVIVLLIFAHSAARVARYQSERPAPVNWSLSIPDEDAAARAANAPTIDMQVDPTVQQIGAEAGD